MLLRIVAMLTKLLMRFDPEQYGVHESAAALATPFEREHPGKAGLFQSKAGLNLKKGRLVGTSAGD
jgi:hypothetical protein